MFRAKPEIRWRTNVNILRVLGLALTTTVLLASGCDSPTSVSEDLSRPPQTGDGWETAPLHSVGMERGPLSNLLELIDGTEDHLIHSLLIIRHQKLVFEKYWPGADLEPAGLDPVERYFDRETLHYVASVSKSITSALAGIALDQGFIGSVDELLFDFFPEDKDLRTGQAAEVTLKHLLSFTSGFHWNEFVYGFEDPRDSHNMMFNSEDPIRHLLARPMDTSPGTEFHYNSGDTNLLGEVVRRESSSATLIDFAVENLFGPLGIVDFLWTRFGAAPEVTFASGGASLRPRDMAKLGALYLNGGVWNGIRVVSEEWVTESTVKAVPLSGDHTTLNGYGYNWWLGDFQFRGTPVKYFRAAGWGGQDVFVIPDLEMVVVFTAGGYYDSRPLSPESMIQDYIFGAIVDRLRLDARSPGELQAPATLLAQPTPPPFAPLTPGPARAGRSRETPSSRSLRGRDRVQQAALVRIHPPTTEDCPSRPGRG